MTAISLPIEERLSTVRFKTDEGPHIELERESCQSCRGKPCLHVCPAECYKADQDGVMLSYEGCLECGTCRILCELKAIKWRYPRGGFGVGFRY